MASRAATLDRAGAAGDGSKFSDSPEERLLPWECCAQGHAEDPSAWTSDQTSQESHDSWEGQDHEARFEQAEYHDPETQGGLQASKPEPGYSSAELPFTDVGIFQGRISAYPARWFTQPMPATERVHDKTVPLYQWRSAMPFRVSWCGTGPLYKARVLAIATTASAVLSCF